LARVVFGGPHLELLVLPVVLLAVVGSRVVASVLQAVVLLLRLLLRLAYGQTFRKCNRRVVSGGLLVVVGKVVSSCR
jgi:hypothetical protein